MLCAYVELLLKKFELNFDLQPEITSKNFLLTHNCPTYSIGVES